MLAELIALVWCVGTWSRVMLYWSRGHVELVTWAFLLVGSGVCYILMEIGGVVAALLVLFLSWWSPRKKRWC